MEALKVLFVHGKESSPQGTKARRLAEAFVARTDAMDTSDFAASVAVQQAAITQFAPDVVVGSSFGGAVVCELLRRGVWRGPTLLLAQAGLLYDPSYRLPAGVPAVLVHGTRDDIVPRAHSRTLAATGDPSLTVLYEPDDDHRLTRTVESGALLDHVREVARLGRSE